MSVIKPMPDGPGLAGRLEIFIDPVKITENNIVDILTDCMALHNQNVLDMNYLFDYERGIQPIRDREKKFREDINVKVVENGAAQILDFKLGYEFSAPITFVQRANRDSHGDHQKKEDNRISLFNQMMEEEGKAEVDLKLARDFKTCGVGYRMFQPKKDVEDLSPFEMTVLNPRCAFVAKWNDAFRKPALGVSFVRHVDGSIRYGCYTKEWYFDVYGDNVDKTPNVIGEIPIIEYVNDHTRMGCFERVIPILNAINIINSDRINDIVQHVQSLLWMNNAEIDDEQYKILKEDGIIQTLSKDGVQASIKYLESVLNQAETQSLVDYEYGRALEITNVPNRQDAGGGSTTGSTNLSSGWMAADMAAKSAETLFTGSENRSNRVALAIIRNSADVSDDMKDLKVSDIQPKFSRNKTYDLATKANSLATLLKSGIDALRAIETVGLFTDPQQVYEDSKEMVREIQQAAAKDKGTSTDPEKQPEDFKQTDVKPQPSEVTEEFNE